MYIIQASARSAERAVRPALGSDAELVRGLPLAYHPGGSEMNANEIVAVVLAAPGAEIPWAQERYRVPIGGTSSLARIRRALTEAGVPEVFLIADVPPEDSSWAAVASPREAAAALAGWSRGRSLLCLCGDVPLLTPKTIREFLDAAVASRASRFVESTGAMALLRTSDEATKALAEALRALDVHPLGASPCGDGTWRAHDPDDMRRLLRPEDYAAVLRLARLRKTAALAAGGVLIPDPERTYVDDETSAGAGTTLLPGTHILRGSTIGAGCEIGPDSWIEASAVEDGAVVRYSVLQGARVRARSKIGPFAHLREESDVGPDARVGNFVEIKASRLAACVKAGHLAYVGDADVGAGTNIGAGAITCNYDGEAKHRTVIGSGAFVGTNVSIVAPVTVGDGAFLAAGSTITDDVPPGALAIARARQVNKEPKQTASREDT